eukprot:COSAG03_NODE_21499_length_303_cov_0.985294_2_plen_26_part_01
MERADMNEAARRAGSSLSLSLALSLS